MEIDYQGLYEDILEMEHKAVLTGHPDFARECHEFRVELLMRGWLVMGRVSVW